MKNMNFEGAKWGRGALDGELLSEEELDERRRRRRMIIIIAAIALLALAALAFFMSRGEAPAAADPKAKGAEASPRVTVIIPGRQEVGRVISGTGSLAARYDMPVGVSGEGGTVSRVLVQPGQWVGAGQTLAVIERSVQSQQAQQAAANIEVARADARLAQSELDRANALVGRGFISKADIDRKRATRDAANARVRVAQAQLGELRARIGKLDVRAPTAGLVLDRSVEVGQVVSAGSGALFRIAQNGLMEMVARLPESDLLQLSTGVPATVTPVGSAQSFSGQIWQISPVVDPQTRQGEARIAIPYSKGIRPGGFASAEIRSGSVNAPLLPESAVLTDDQGSYVMVVGADNKVQRRGVKIGSVTDKGVVVAEGLNGNEAVVESAGAFLNAGEKVLPERKARQ